SARRYDAWCGRGDARGRLGAEGTVNPVPLTFALFLTVLAIGFAVVCVRAPNGLGIGLVGTVVRANPDLAWGLLERIQGGGPRAPVPDGEANGDTAFPTLQVRGEDGALFFCIAASSDDLASLAARVRPTAAALARTHRFNPGFSGEIRIAISPRSMPDTEAL